MHPKNFALVIGIIYFALGVLGFIPGLVANPADIAMYGANAVSDPGYGLLFNIFPVNAVLNIIYILLGIGGIAAYSSKYRSLPASINYSRVLFAVAGILSILGMIYATSTGFGFAPLFGNNIWLNGFASLLGAYFGYRLTSEVEEPRTDVPTHEHLTPTRPV
jgi:hypothetical protein